MSQLHWEGNRSCAGGEITANFRRNDPDKETVPLRRLKPAQHAVLVTRNGGRPGPQGRLMIPQDEILGALTREESLRAHRTTSFPVQPSLRDCFCCMNPTQDFILGYLQPSLRDCCCYGRNLHKIGPATILCIAVVVLNYRLCQSHHPGRANCSALPGGQLPRRPRPRSGD